MEEEEAGRAGKAGRREGERRGGEWRSEGAWAAAGGAGRRGGPGAPRAASAPSPPAARPAPARAPAPPPPAPAPTRPSGLSRRLFISCFTLFGLERGARPSLAWLQQPPLGGPPDRPRRGGHCRQRLAESQGRPWALGDWKGRASFGPRVGEGGRGGEGRRGPEAASRLSSFLLAARSPTAPGFSFAASEEGKGQG